MIRVTLSADQIAAYLKWLNDPIGVEFMIGAFETEDNRIEVLAPCLVAGTGMASEFFRSGTSEA